MKFDKKKEILYNTAIALLSIDENYTLNREEQRALDKAKKKIGKKIDKIKQKIVNQNVEETI